jgi:AcrR family transcriptional regulator
MSIVMDEEPTGTSLPVVSPTALPLAEETPRERSDAARNRMKVLAAAEELFARHGPDCVSMEAIAAAAGVGKGTLFRRFGDRAGLAHALLDERERRLQEQMIRGEPPLGPGAPPRERLIAFGCALLALPDEHRAILVAADVGGARFRHPAYAFWRTHVAVLLREADPTLDAEVIADFLLAGLRADLIRHLHTERGIQTERLAQAWEALVCRVIR